MAITPASQSGELWFKSRPYERLSNSDFPRFYSVSHSNDETVYQNGPRPLPSTSFTLIIHCAKLLTASQKHPQHSTAITADKLLME